MALIRWEPMGTYSPWRRLSTIENTLDRFFDDGLGFLHGELPYSSSDWTPSVDIYEDESSIVVLAEVPGISREDIEVNVKENVLTIKGEKKSQRQEGETVHRCETCLGQFDRSFNLPATVDTENINASYTDGILRITLPKKEEAKPKLIEVKVA